VFDNFYLEVGLFIIGFYLSYWYGWRSGYASALRIAVKEVEKLVSEGVIEVKTIYQEKNRNKSS
jgi:hypothetical protein